MIRKLLHRMREGGADINAMTRDLGIGRGTLDAILEMAIMEGYLKKVSIRSNCGGCPLRGTSGVEPSECDKTEIYIVTPEGEKFRK